MTIEERAELAVETFAAGKGNCTQSVLCAWEDKIPVDHDTLMKLGAGYGAGMGCMQATCGALIGAVMAAGSVTDGKGTPRTARSILTSFQEKSGATICKDLKGGVLFCIQRFEQGMSKAKKRPSGAFKRQNGLRSKWRGLAPTSSD